MSVVSVGGLVLDEETVSSVSVTVNMTGWTDAPEVRSSMEARAQQDGAWDSSGFFSGRSLEVSGFVEGVDAPAALAYGDALRALSPRVLHEVLVEDAVGPRSTMARLTRGAVLEWANDRAFSYTVQLMAPDPLLYGPPVSYSTNLSGAAGTGRVWPTAWPRDWGVPAGTTPGSVSLPNAGTATYWPTLRIDGPVANPVITLNETGDWIRIGRTVAAGQWLDIDCGSRRVLLNGQVSLAAAVTSSGRWLAVPTGGGSVSWAADAADPAALLTINGFEGAYL